ncbi:alpha/beta hydrolase [Streptacidiphilus sp. PB12-B1b]|uniref:alpha/beta fold hydrolase n=1 Tax=Streptacidiphilus sp. PB12-B1b TaxID=2705012 RepID=UPI0015FAB8A8|nr:alpha/beta hydrolase [Streptacidiphilus sp. PB12-B1b]QMU78355.1 alpha/beta hydrolase [Streptacidiphilus sp. PB12-B1b]
MNGSSCPTVVLVHGGFTDAGSWARVITELRKHDIPVYAPPNPLRGLAADSAYIASVAERIRGPVILVGHAYGGAVISVAGMADNVVALVYVAAFIPDEGESVAELQGRFRDSLLAAHLSAAPRPIDGSEPGTDFSIRPDAFRAVFAADLPQQVTAVLAVAQRPVAEAALAEKATAPAWRCKPSWALIAGADQVINPEVERFGADRAASATVEADGASHAVALSRPAVVAALIRDAVDEIS